MLKISCAVIAWFGLVACSAPETMSPPPTAVTIRPDALPVAPSVLVPCNLPDSSRGLAVREFSGIYERAFERSDFAIDDASCRVWLTGDLTRACEAVGGCQKGSRFTMRLRVRGTISPPGRYGHLGMYAQELHVNEVTSVTLISGAS